VSSTLNAPQGGRAVCGHSSVATRRKVLLAAACKASRMRVGTELAPESDRGSNVFGQGCDGPAPLAGGALVHGQHA
jgi:hypothetical protein